jgi:hypothetical protein
MRLLLSLVIALVGTAFNETLQAADAHTKGESQQKRALQYALSLVGTDVARLPIELVSVPYDGAPPWVEAWTTFTADGKGLRIFVLNNTPVFRCAITASAKCVRLLAALLVHEVWHFRHGFAESEAYRAQIIFLQLHGDLEDEVDGVRRRRDQALKDLE